jgi:hypothetical protein
MSEQLEIPSIEEIKDYYLHWFEENYCIKPTANCTATATFAQAAMQHFLAREEG